MTITKLKLSRLSRGLTQQDLGFHSRTGATDISKFENRRSVPYPAQALRIAKVLGLSPDELQEPAEQNTEAVQG